ncbi:hypothetical protein ACFV5N_09705 [Streptomyces sp. NPDC059853]
MPGAPALGSGIVTPHHTGMAATPVHAHSLSALDTRAPVGT